MLPPGARRVSPARSQCAESAEFAAIGRCGNARAFKLARQLAAYYAAIAVSTRREPPPTGTAWATAIGHRIAQALYARGVPLVVIEQNRELVERLRAEGRAAVFGNAVEPETLVQAHVADARLLVITIPQTVEVRQMVETARALNPDIEVVVRSHNEEEAQLLQRELTGRVFVGESELARSITEYILQRVA